MKEPAPSHGRWGTFKLAWKASEKPRGRYIDPTLYSEQRLANWIPLKFSTAVPWLLYFLVFYNVLFLIVGLEGALAFAFNAFDVMIYLFYQCTFSLILLPWIAVDLHKRRRHRLRPKRIVITSCSALFILLTPIGLWGYSYLVYGLEAWYWGGQDLCWNYGVFCVNLSPLLPFIAIFDFVFYAVYLSFGIVAMLRDYTVKVPDEVQAKYVVEEMQPRVAINNTSVPERSSQDRDSYTQLSSLYDSSVAEISGHTSMTVASSTGVSNSLVTAGSARSSALLSSGSSDLPAYSGTGSASHSQRHSIELQSLSESLSQPEQVHLRVHYDDNDDQQRPHYIQDG